MQNYTMVVREKEVNRMEYLMEIFSLALVMILMVSLSYAHLEIR
ncbi:hypothetical protein QT06_C0001G0886 [archaeon GW2011_AR15]|nr:hypothetical protein QT06_C0001G0886 [archaeon GW2011_AR15]